jgi:hypothetical protein
LDSRLQEALNTARAYSAGCGIQTAALAFGGNSSMLQEQQKNTMEHLGQQGGSLNTARSMQLAGAGIQTAALAFGGDTPHGSTVTNATEQYDGTSWTTLPATLS